MFFSQAAAGIRYLFVPGFQTCALPISVDARRGLAAQVVGDLGTGQARIGDEPVADRVAQLDEAPVSVDHRRIFGANASARKLRSQRRQRERTSSTRMSSAIETSRIHMRRSRATSRTSSSDSCTPRSLLVRAW